jgi:N-acetylglucosaminyldiphosphoundecaprenol N-acetyl-beta-D-mannosaminyltransferase
MPRRKRVRLGTIFADVLTFDGAIDEIVALARSGKGGYVVTPNVDHVVLAETDARLRAAYDGAALSLIDSVPLMWMARALGEPFPEKIAGSDLGAPLVARAADEGLRVFFLGAAPGVGQRAADALVQANPALEVAGVYSPPLGFEQDDDELGKTLDAVRDARPHLVLVALGCPKQELFMHEHAQALSPAVCLGIGATLDFIAGNVKRAPRWMQRVGLEWFHRLASDPRRMAHRYLVRDPALGPIFLRGLRRPAPDRAFYVELPETAAGGRETRPNRPATRST